MQLLMLDGQSRQFEVAQGRHSTTEALVLVRTVLGVQAEQLEDDEHDRQFDEHLAQMPTVELMR